MYHQNLKTSKLLFKLGLLEIIVPESIFKNFQVTIQDIIFVNSCIIITNLKTSKLLFKFGKIVVSTGEHLFKNFQVTIQVKNGVKSALSMILFKNFQVTIQVDEKGKVYIKYS